MEIKFGTDGWRGIIADDFTFQNVRYCAQSYADYLNEAGLAEHGLVVGYDTRFASEDFAAAAAEVIAANGIRVYLCSKTAPTPVISYGVRHLQAGGAIIITASHNPAKWNGFKIKSPDGASAPTAVERDVEARIPGVISSASTISIPLQRGIAENLIQMVDLDPPYFAQLAKLVDLPGIRQGRFSIAVDSMFGAGSGYFRRLMEGGTTTVHEINGERNPVFPGIQPEPIGRHLAKLAETMKTGSFSIGLATDGDADRVGMVDERGTPLTPLQIFALLALYLLEVKGERGTIVKTITTTNMLHGLGKLYGVTVLETPVGFKHVAPKMMELDALIGGEESSGFGFRGHVPERDSIVAGLYMLDLMKQKNMSPSELIEYLYGKVGPHHYYRLDLEFPASERDRIMDNLTSKTIDKLANIHVVKLNTMDGYHFTLEDGSWLLFRFSGTEPLLRIYSEAGSLERARALVSEGRHLLGV